MTDTRTSTPPPPPPANKPMLPQALEVSIMDAPLATRADSGELKLGSLAQIMQVATILKTSGIIKGRTSEEIATKLLMAMEMNLPPMAALQGLYVHEQSGSIEMKASLIKNQIDRHPRYSYRPVVYTDDRCQVDFYEGDKLYISIDYDWARATKGFASSRNWTTWQKFQRDFLFKQCFLIAARVLPGLFNGTEVYGEGETVDLSILPGSPAPKKTAATGKKDPGIDQAPPAPPEDDAQEVDVIDDPKETKSGAVSTQQQTDQTPAPTVSGSPSTDQKLGSSIAPSTTGTATATDAAGGTDPKCSGAAPSAPAEAQTKSQPSASTQNGPTGTSSAASNAPAAPAPLKQDAAATANATGATSKPDPKQNASAQPDTSKAAPVDQATSEMLNQLGAKAKACGYASAPEFTAAVRKETGLTGSLSTMTKDMVLYMIDWFVANKKLPS